MKRDTITAGLRVRRCGTRRVGTVITPPVVDKDDCVMVKQDDTGIITTWHYSRLHPVRLSKLERFAIQILVLLENTPDWNADVTDAIAELAQSRAFDLADADDDGQFRSKIDAITGKKVER